MPRGKALGLRRAGPPIRPPRPQRPEASPGETGARLQPRPGPRGVQRAPTPSAESTQSICPPPTWQEAAGGFSCKIEDPRSEHDLRLGGQKPQRPAMGSGGVSWRPLLPPSHCPDWPRPEPGQNWVGRRKEGPAQTGNSPPRRPVSPATAPAAQAARPRASVARGRVALRGTPEWSVSPAEVGGTPQMAMGLCYKSHHPTSALSRNLSPKGCEWSWGHGTSHLHPTG